MKTKYSIKQILLSNQNWWRFYEKHKARLRIGIVICIVKLLSCKNSVRGYQEYHCSNPNCSHIKRIPFTCKCKACSSCGKKATEIWITKQNQILPYTSWQHITFTMPSELWPFFWFNRFLLNQISAISAHCITSIADKKKITPGIFTALHTFSRSSTRNVHVHLSTTTGGLTKDRSQWKNLFFDQSTLMRMWRYQIISLFRDAYQQNKLIIPTALRKKLNHTFTFNHFLDQLYRKAWIVHCSKPATNHQQNVGYFSRYIKRPPIAESRLQHYNGNEITFRYLDHKTKHYQNASLTPEQFIARLIQHIPDVGFRMIRYYGFLANRVRGKLLPLVHQLLSQGKPPATSSPTFSVLMQQNFGFDPLRCVLCGQQLFLSVIHLGKKTVTELLACHRELALLKNC